MKYDFKGIFRNVEKIVSLKSGEKIGYICEYIHTFRDSISPNFQYEKCIKSSGVNLNTLCIHYIFSIESAWDY